MAANSQSTGTSSWTNPERCPFCNAHLSDGGWGFIAHVRASPPCKTEFDIWREQIAGDIGGEWSE